MFWYATLVLDRDGGRAEVKHMPDGQTGGSARTSAVPILMAVCTDSRMVVKCSWSGGSYPIGVVGVERISD